MAFETNSVKVLLSYNSTLAVNVNLSLRSRPPKLVSDSGMQEWNLENVCLGNIMLVEFGILCNPFQVGFETDNVKVILS